MSLQAQTKDTVPAASYPSFYVTSAGLVAGTGFYLINHAANPITPTQLSQIRLQNIPHFERFATRQYHPGLNKYGDVLLGIVVVAPALILLDKKKNHFDFALHYTEVLSLSLFITQAAKMVIPRYRPFTYNLNVDANTRMSADARQSFFSQHTSVCAAATFYTAAYLREYLHSRKARRWVWCAAALIPSIEGWGRVASGDHFITDVAAGYAVGAACGYMTYHFSH